MTCGYLLNRFQKAFKKKVIHTMFVFLLEGTNRKFEVCPVIYKFNLIFLVS